MRRIWLPLVLILIVLLVSCSETFRYDLMADRIDESLAEYLEDGTPYPCTSDHSSVAYCSYKKTGEGFIFILFDSTMSELFRMTRTFTITAHDKITISYLSVCVDGSSHAIYFQ